MNRWYGIRSIMLIGMLNACAEPQAEPERAPETSDVETDRSQDATSGAWEPSDGAPPEHTLLANSVWPVSHGSAYSQGSSDRPGPTHPDVRCNS